VAELEQLGKMVQPIQVQVEMAEQAVPIHFLVQQLNMQAAVVEAENLEHLAAVQLAAVAQALTHLQQTQELLIQVAVAELVVQAALAAQAVQV
jgi:hypothetical protein